MPVATLLESLGLPPPAPAGPFASRTDSSGVSGGSTRTRRATCGRGAVHVGPREPRGREAAPACILPWVRCRAEQGPGPCEPGPGAELTESLLRRYSVAS
jgi:hypothetical protein